jgi:hypothetical protein
MSDLTGKIIGWRDWTLDAHGTLHPLSMATPDNAWTAGVNEARCCGDPTHAAPVHECECGLYARYDLAGVNGSSLRSISGVILAWGAVELHADGFRAQFAEILCLVCGLDAPVLERMVVEQVADRYGVPVLSQEKAIAQAQEFGRFVPSELRPEPDLTPWRPGITIGSGSGLTATARIAGNSFNVGNFVASTGGASYGVRIANGLKPRPAKLSNFHMSNSHLHFASGVEMSSGSLTNCYIEGADFHPGPVARALVAIGAIAGVAIGFLVAVMLMGVVV